ncbi:hypothetical protein [Campylobacter concisus]
MMGVYLSFIEREIWVVRMLPYPQVLHYFPKSRSIFLINVLNLFIAVKFGICVAFDLLFCKNNFLLENRAKES